jgi:hypothetical protein
MSTTRLFLVSLALLASAPPLVAKVAETRSWEFSVSLDGSPIGYHNYELVEDNDGRQVISEASFDVRFLFFNAFKYRHTNREFWQGNCLASIDSETRQNNQSFSVNGERVADRFTVKSDGGEMDLDTCVMSFAYWDPSFLEQSKLLNPQSGEYLPVDVEDLGKQEVVVRGTTMLASAYRVKARATELIVWYSDDNEWLGLESVAKGGRIIRYELT